MTGTVRIDTDLCEGHAQCVHAAPAVFDIADSDECARVLIAQPPEELRAAVEDARSLCPTRAITVEG
jgi:ferredoxin